MTLNPLQGNTCGVGIIQGIDGKWAVYKYGTWCGTHDSKREAIIQAQKEIAWETYWLRGRAD